MARNKFDVDERLESPFQWRHMKRAGKYIARHKYQMLLALLLSAMASVATLFIPKITQWVLDVAVPGKDAAMIVRMALLFMGNLLCIIGLVPAVGTALGLLPFFISHPWRILALVLLGAVYYLICCGGGALLYRAEHRLNRRAVPGIFGFPVFLVTWMPINMFACLTPPPRWKQIAHVRDIGAPDAGD